MTADESSNAEGLSDNPPGLDHSDPIVPKRASVAEILAKILPEHTHILRDLFGPPCQWSWTTPAGVWIIVRPKPFTGSCWSVTTPYGELYFPQLGFPSQLETVLVALGGIHPGQSDCQRGCAL
jgi:hypothetical protein